MGTIHWAEFDWPSFATLATGAMAVLAALVVGLKQTHIADRQTKILEQQTKLAELTLRHNLFEKRYVIYDATRHFLGEILSHATRPKNETQQRFISALLESKLLFRPEVYEGLDAIWKRATTFYVANSEEKRGGVEAIQRSHDLLNALSDDLTGLVALFGDELRLSDSPMHR
jgi:hypothetical protein